jgi:beta-phosphoglucomutase-like phosphatase (HAD superfamily)
MQKNIREYRGALFDLDGVLLDSMQVWDRLCRDWLAGEGKTPDADLERDLAAMTLRQGAEYVIRRYGSALSPGEIVSRWEGLVLDAYKTTIPLKEETAALVRELYDAGLSLAVVTSCFPAACEAALKRHGLRRFFSAILYTGDTPGDKSSPALWRAAAARLGLDSADCVVFEDAFHALRGVRGAGMGFAAVYDNSCREWDLMKAQADWVFGGTEHKKP